MADDALSGSFDLPLVPSPAQGPAGGAQDDKLENSSRTEQQLRLGVELFRLEIYGDCNGKRFAAQIGRRLPAPLRYCGESSGSEGGIAAQNIPAIGNPILVYESFDDNRPANTALERGFRIIRFDDPAQFQ